MVDGGCLNAPGTTVRLRLTGDVTARRKVASQLRRRSTMTVVATADAILVDLPMDRIERTGPSVEARATEAGLDLWIDELNAVIPRSDLEGYGSRIWAALGDAFVRNELAIERGEEPSTDPYAFVRVVDQDGQRRVENARTSWDPPTREAVVGPPYWDDVPATREVEAAIGSDPGIVIVEMHPDRPPTISRRAAVHEDPELETLLPSPRPGETWAEVESYVDPPARRLRRGLRELGVDRRTTSEVFAIHGSGPDVVTAMLHRVPGARSADLARVFSTTVLGFKRSPWTTGRLEGVDVLVGHDLIDGVEHFGVMVTEDGLVAILGGRQPAVAKMLRSFVAARAT